MNGGSNNVIETRVVRKGLSCRSSVPYPVITMLDVGAPTDADTLWVLAINTVLHELGLPVPMVPVALLAGARATSGMLDPLIQVFTILIGTVLGNSVWFAAGRRKGFEALKLICRVSLSPDACVTRTENAWGRWGWSSLVVGRFLPGVSLVAPPLAGALGMSWKRFLVLTSAGAALYGLALVAVGVLLRSQIEWVISALEGFGWHIFATFIALIAIYIAWRAWQRYRRA